MAEVHNGNKHRMAVEGGSRTTIDQVRHRGVFGYAERDLNVHISKIFSGLIFPLPHNLALSIMRYGFGFASGVPSQMFARNEEPELVIDSEVSHEIKM